MISFRAIDKSAEHAYPIFGPQEAPDVNLRKRVYQ